MHRHQRRQVPALFITVLLFLVSFEATSESNQTAVSTDRMHAMNYVVVSPEGPTDGGDFGPHTPDTKTSGIQEAFNFAKANRKDVYIAGGTMPDAFANGVVYHIQETIHIPWFQDFRLDGGEYVINYDSSTGDAIVIDSQMSCRMKFGLIVCPSDGVGVRLRPETKGPDGFSVITTSTFEFNAIVGGGSVFQDGKKLPTGTGLFLDASQGAIVYNTFYATEVIACQTGLLMTCGPEGNPATAIANNAFEIPFLHLCSTHVQVGDAHANVSRNIFQLNIDGAAVSDAAGICIFGKQNLFTVDIIQVAPGRGIVFEATAEANHITAMNLAGGLTNNATRPTNKVIVLEPIGFAVDTPEFPPSGETVVNRTCFSIEALILDAKLVSEWTLADADGTSQRVNGPLNAGQTISFEPGDALTFVYTQSPSWRWRAR